MTPLQKAQKRYNSKRPAVSFRLTQTEAEQMEMIKRAKESLNQAVARVFRDGLKGNQNG